MKANSSRFTIYLVSIIAAMTGLLFGFDTGIISGALLFIQKDFPVSTEVKEMIVSSVLLGAMAGSLFCGRLTDYYGRRKVMLIISALFIIGTVLATTASAVTGIIVGRLCIGLAIGIGSYSAPLYIAEAAPLHLRGGLVSFNQLAITIGILVSFIVNLAFTEVNGSWRWMFAIGIIPAVLLSIGMLLLPESPRWLVKCGKVDQAKKTLKYLRGDVDVDQELSEIQKTLHVRSASLSEIFASWSRPVLFLGVMLGFLQQVTGINTIIYYAPTIFQMAGFHSNFSSILATIGIGVVNVLSTVFAIYFLDKIGRRPLLLAGLIGMCVSLLSLSWAFSFNAHSDMLRWMAVASTFFYIICFAFSLGAMLWLMVSEIFPLQVRGIAMSVAVFSCWFWNFVVSSTFLTLLEKVGPGCAFLLYAAMCAFGFVFCFYKVPETSGVSLEQIENNIRKRMPLRAIGQPVLANLTLQQAEQ